MQPKCASAYYKDVFQAYETFVAPFSWNQTASDVEELTRKDSSTRDAWMKMRDSIHKVQESYYIAVPTALRSQNKPDHPICTQLRRNIAGAPRGHRLRVVSAEEWKSEFPDPKIDQSE